MHSLGIKGHDLQDFAAALIDELKQNDLYAAFFQQLKLFVILNGV